MDKLYLTLRSLSLGIALIYFCLWFLIILAVHLSCFVLFSMLELTNTLHRGYVMHRRVRKKNNYSLDMQPASRPNSSIVMVTIESRTESRFWSNHFTVSLSACYRQTNDEYVTLSFNYKSRVNDFICKVRSLEWGHVWWAKQNEKINIRKSNLFPQMYII